MKGQTGSVALPFVCFLPLMLAIGFALYLFLSFSDSHIEMTQTCLREQIKIQQAVKKSLQSLLKLNSRALSLKAQLKAAHIRRLAAMATLNPPAAAAAQVQIQIITGQKQLLHLQQNAIIQLANFQLAKDQQVLSSRLTQIGEHRKKSFQSFMSNEISGLKYKKTTLAVVASDSGIAPTYSLSQNFIEEQALEFTWHLKMISQKAIAQFLVSENNFPQSCSTTINSKEARWPTVTREVKSWWKLRS